MNTIEFTPANETNNTTTSPWALPQREKKTYEDLILKPEHAERIMRFPLGQTWLRIVPALASSAHNWMLPLHVLNYEGGRFAHPRTLKARTASVFDLAYVWAKENAPEGLYSKANNDGARLLSNPMCLYWTLVEEEGKYVARLLCASGYDGSRSGTPGLGWRIRQLCHERDENNDLVADAVSANNGVLISVEKGQAKGAYPSYTLRLGRQPRPMADLLAQMEPEEIAALCPLENTIRELTDEEQWACLGKVIAPETVTAIRKSSGR